MSNIYRESISRPSDRVILALDNMSWGDVAEILPETEGLIGMGKINSLSQKEGWAHAIHFLDRYGFRTMADPKYHDIPKTVELHVQSVAKERASFITLHASGGEEMLKFAVNAREEAKHELSQNGDIPIDEKIGGLLGVTVLTSLGEKETISIYGDKPAKKVLQFARIALNSGIDGIVCSGKELKAIRSNPDLDELITVVPGITPAWTTKAQDQKRVVTPKEAIAEGADYIVIGRAITSPPNGVSRKEAAQRIADEIKEA